MTPVLRRVANAAIVCLAAAVLIFNLHWILLGLASLVLVVAVCVLLTGWIGLWAFRLRHAMHGRDLLIVLSNSPHWQSHIEREWLSRWRERAVVLNWSERRSWHWWTPEVMLFRTSTGATEFNPVAIVVPPRFGRRTVIPFWRAFKDAKHGNDRALRLAEQALETALARAPAATLAARRAR